MQRASLSFTILSLMLVAQLGTDIYLASIPSISYDLGSSVSIIQYTFSIFLLGFAFSQLLYGPAADVFGRRRCSLVGLAIYSLAAFLSSTADSALALILFRLLQGIGAGGCTVAGRAMMQDAYSGKNLDHINALQSMTWSLVPIAAPLLGSYIQHYLGWRYNFLILFVLGSLLLIFTFFSLQETHTKRDSHLYLRKLFHDYGHFFANGRFILHLAGCGCVISLLSIFNISAPVIIQKIFGLSPLFYGWSIFFVAMSFCTGSFVSRLCLKKMASSSVISYGVIGLFAAAVLQLAFLITKETTLSTFLIPIFFYQFFSALIFPSLAASTMRPIKEKIGRASALFGFALFSMSAALSAAVAALLGEGLAPFTWMNAVVVTLLLIIIRILRRKYHE